MPVLEVIVDVDHDINKYVDQLQWRMRAWGEDEEKGVAGSLAADLLRIAHRVSQHDRKLIPAMAKLKWRMNAAMEALDDDTAYLYDRGVKLEEFDEGNKIIAYEFLKVMQEEWEEMINFISLLEMGYICKSVHHVKQNFGSYITAVRSKIEAKVEMMESPKN